MTKRSRTNHLLQQLSPKERSVVHHYLEPIELLFKEELYEQNKRIEYLYFPTSGVVSLLTVMHSDIIETGTVGREGCAGIPAFLGARLAPGRALSQVPGRGLRMKVSDLPAVLAAVGKLRTVLMLYTNALMAMVAQSGACNRAHDVIQRMARWLLMTHDRVDGDDLLLTQEFLGQMLGVRRPAVNAAGQRLQEDGYIKYSRGRIRIMDRRGLERTACECYAFTVKAMRVRVQ